MLMSMFVGVDVSIGVPADAALAIRAASSGSPSGMEMLTVGDP